MCFSAGASFGASVLLGAGAIVSMRQVREPSQRMFAATPLLFAVQQLSEGFLWLGIEKKLPHSAVLWSTYVFLTFAQVIWPMWVPLSLHLMEKNKTRKKAILYFLSAIGLLTSVLLAYRLLFLSVETVADNHHIYYDITSPYWIMLTSSILYFIATIPPWFISSIRHAKILGVFLCMSLIFSKLYFEETLISVWCFFAAILSAGIIFILRTENKPVSDRTEG
jgi:hypothetical protein